MKIAHLTPSYSPHIGGMERCVESLAGEQARMGHDVSVFTGVYSSLSKSSRAGDLGVNVHRLRSLRVVESPFTPSLAAELSKCKFDIIHGHMFHFYYPEIGVFVSKLRSTPFVSHMHLDPDQSHGLLLQRLYKWISTHVVISLSDAVIVPTVSYRLLVNRKYGRVDQVHVIPYGIDSSMLSFSNGCAREKYEILFVGRISRQKGLDLLVQAMQEIVSFIPEAELIVVGPPSTHEGRKIMRLLQEEIAELRLNDHIHFMGGLDADQTRRMFERATVFVAPSRFESFGIVLLEAMASGIPIVASDIPPFREVAGCAAMYFRTISELVDGVVGLISDERLRATLVSRGSARVKDYTWERINERVMQVYEECTS